MGAQPRLHLEDPGTSFVRRYPSERNIMRPLAANGLQNVAWKQMAALLRGPRWREGLGTLKNKLGRNDMLRCWIIQHSFPLAARGFV
ncbi:hypothetical protein NDU88_005832 [Pleurodeles waltl]|uniref:Uncharacterized protein n=1 Tax=Pleurodeles waltl TaxID=8319 RepID=A0AAV7L215_PLEWA|nr:hypothetical protein NDU88_005832 [Pleurodeles waltl]